MDKEQSDKTAAQLLGSFLNGMQPPKYYHLFNSMLWQDVIWRQSETKCRLDFVDYMTVHCERLNYEPENFAKLQPGTVNHFWKFFYQGWESCHERNDQFMENALEQLNSAHENLKRERQKLWLAVALMTGINILTLLLTVLR